MHVVLIPETPNSTSVNAHYKRAVILPWFPASDCNPALRSFFRSYHFVNMGQYPALLDINHHCGTNLEFLYTDAQPKKAGVAVRVGPTAVLDQ